MSQSSCVTFTLQWHRNGVILVIYLQRKPPHHFQKAPELITMYSDSDQRRVYLACRAIFTGTNAQLRRSKKVRELVSTHRRSLQPLIQEFTAEKVVNIIKNLLEKEIFQSDVKAKIEFPELFRSSPTRDAQRAASENDAARSAAEALEEVASREGAKESDDEKGNDIVNLNQGIAAGKRIKISSAKMED